MSNATRPEAEEGELIRRSRKGDGRAFSTLVERYQRRVAGVAMAVVHNQDDALEIAQEAFVRAYQSLGKFEERSSFSTWLYRITANLAIDFRRREGRQVVLRGEEGENELGRIPSGTGDSFTEAARGELGQRLSAALKELTPEHRAVILLREVDGLSYDEISEVLDCPRGTVMSRLHYARGHLRGILKDVDKS
ncbi:MAG TPA: sigma-70 family RNA polymerase sigma factor [Candidatus Binataceae bacterium]|nr:sigma-70 family RNA polymerase sigma factor [Candidatus Binataceae bacterium]